MTTHLAHRSMVSSIEKTGQLMSFAVGILVCCSFAVGQEQFELSDTGFLKVASSSPESARAVLQNIRTLIAGGDITSDKKRMQRRDARSNINMTDIGRGRRAEKLATLWLNQHRYHPLTDEAVMLRGDAKIMQEHYFRALFDYEFLVRAYPESKYFHTALERELEIARVFSSGVNRRFAGMRILPAKDETEEILIRIQERAPASYLAEVACKELGDFYFNQSDMNMAAEAYKLLLENYPNSQWTNYAKERQIEANQRMFKGTAYDATGLLEARRRLRDFKQNTPDTTKQSECNVAIHKIEEKLAKKQLLAARWYDNQHDYIGAEFMYRRLLADFPTSEVTNIAKKRLAELVAKICIKERHNHRR